MDVPNWNQRADAAFELRRYDAALEAVMHGLAVAPNDARLLALGAQTLEKQKKYAAARDMARQAIAADPEFSNGYFWLASALLDVPAADRDDDELRRATRSLVELNPNDRASHQMAAQVAWHFGDLEEAERSLRRAMELDPGCEYTLHTLGRVLRQRAKYAEAREWLQQALALHPNSGCVRRELAWVSLCQNRPSEALPFALAARDLSLNDAESFCALGEAALELGQTKLALQSLADSLALEPNSEYALSLLEDAVGRSDWRTRTLLTLSTRGCYEFAIVYAAALAAAWRQFALPWGLAALLWLVGSVAWPWLLFGLYRAAIFNLPKFRSHLPSSRRRRLELLLIPLTPAFLVAVVIATVATRSWTLFLIGGVLAVGLEVIVELAPRFVADSDPKASD